MFKKVLIANRGEIVVRVAQTLSRMGIRSVGIYSEADRGAVHVGCVDEAYGLPGDAAADTYLRIDKIIDIAKHCGVDAIHPGYGFLSENPTFAAACEQAGIVFIGPSAEVMRLTGNKVTAKKTLAAAGVPVVPGWVAEPGGRGHSTGSRSNKGARQSRAARTATSGSGSPPDAGIKAAVGVTEKTAHLEPDELQAEARRVGFPLLVKAASGGGGKGMRLVRDESEFVQAFESAQREAAAAFGDGHVFLEKYIQRPRHIEVQIFGDCHGNVVHLFERECSIQRRHQKIVEETPSPALAPGLRARMTEAAVRAASAVGYSNAGTVEFLLDESGNFYFLEINTRLQVEHPVTEATLGLDLVEAQVRVAAGERLPFAQEDLRPRGHALECRIYAEDPSRGFVPSTGTIQRYVAPYGPNIRIDSGVAAGSQVTVHYDPMLAKLICWGRTREESIAQARFALDRFVVLGITTNIAFLRRLLDDAQFRAGRIHTGFLEENPLLCQPPEGEPPPEAWIVAALALHKDYGLRAGEAHAAGGGPGMPRSPWNAGPWRMA